MHAARRLLTASGVSGVNPVISTVGTVNTTNSNTNPASISVSPATVGNLLVVGILSFPDFTVSSITGGGVGTWTQLGFFDEVGFGPESLYLYMGVVTTTGASTITLTMSGAATFLGTWVQEFSPSSAPRWAQDGVSTTSSGSGTTLTGPSLTPLGANELYVAVMASAGTLTAGSTSGYTYSTVAGVGFMFNPGIGAPSAPTLTLAPSGLWVVLGALIKA